MREPAAKVGALALTGAALLAWPGHILRIDQLAGTCAGQPPRDVLLGCAAAYLVAVALLALAWRESLRADLPVRTTFWLAAAVHAVAMLFPPFLSSDPMFYATCGKALAVGAGGMPLDHALPGHPWLTLLPADWREGASPYFPGFDQLTRVIAVIAGDRLTVALRAYQLIGALCTFASAALLVRAFDDPKHRARAAALVLLSPLTIIEATQNGHNDALLMLSVTVFAWATVRRRTGLALVSLCAGLLIKASALLMLGLELARHFFARARGVLTPRRVLIAGTALVVAVLAAFLALHERVPALRGASALVGSPRDTWEHCTRSVECLPRALFRYIFHLPRAAWVTGLIFRAAGGLWLLWAAMRAGTSDASPTGGLRWMCTALFVYYLLFHGYMESWYLLSLLPLAAFAPPLIAPVIALFMVTAVAYYPLDMLLSCSWNPVAVGSKEFFEAFITVAVPGMYLLARVVKRPT